jgi:hypothetical protein
MHPNPLKSKTFSTRVFDASQREVMRADIGAVIDLGTGRFATLVPALIEYLTTVSKPEQRRIEERCVAEQGRGPFMAAVRFSSFFFPILARDRPPVDQPDDLASDMVALTMAAPEGQSQLVALLGALSTGVQSFRRHRSQRKASIGVIPALVGMETSVELRAVFDTSLEFGEKSSEIEDDISTVELIPVVSISLKLSNAEQPTKLAFQATPEIVEGFLEELRLAVRRANDIAKEVQAKRGK